MRAVYNKCRELTWPYLKNSTRKQYMEHFKTHLLPEFGNSKVRKLTTITSGPLQHVASWAFTEDDSVDSRDTPRISESGGLGGACSTGNPVVGVKLPRKRAVKPTILPLLKDIRRILEAVWNDKVDAHLDRLRIHASG